MKKEWVLTSRKTGDKGTSTCGQVGGFFGVVFTEGGMGTDGGKNLLRTLGRNEGGRGGRP